MAADRSGRPGWVIWVGTCLMMGLAAFLLAAIDAWITGRWVEAGGLIVSLISGAVVMAITVTGSRTNTVLRDAIPEPANSLVKEALRAKGLTKIRLYYGVSGEPAEYPRPMAFGLQLMISRQVLAGFSNAALLWSAKTDARASLRFTYMLCAIFLPLALLAYVMDCFFDRWKVPSWYFVFPAALFLLSLALLACVGYALQFASDRHFTKTESDRQAAKEALSYPYFAQCDRPRGRKWIFSRLELRGRARRLGIELERGYRAPIPADDQGAEAQR